MGADHGTGAPASPTPGGVSDADHHDADYAAAEDVGLPVAAVARRLGIAAGTLRTWDRRYGLGPSAHRAGSHRRYSREDLERLVAMRRLTLEGVSPADAARTAAAAADDVTPSWSDRADDIPAARPAPPRGSVDGSVASAVAERSSDQHHAPQPPWGQTFDRDAVSLDLEQTTASVSRAFEQHGLVRAWEQLVGPTVHALSRRWATTGPGYDAELMLTSAVLTALRERGPAEPPTSATVLLAPAEDERDTLALHVLATELAERGLSTQVLAPGRPREALGEALVVTEPAVVLVLGTAAVRDVAQLDVLAQRSPGCALVLAGPGWAGVEVPGALGAETVPSLASAVDLVADLASSAQG